VTETAARPAPAVTDLNRDFWTGGGNGKLLIQRCECGRWVHPPAPTCPACGGGALRPEAVSGRGRVFTYTVNRHPFDPSVPVPYVIAVVEPVEQPGLRITTNIVNCPVDSVRIGMEVQVLFEPQGELYIPLFEPAEGPL